MTRLSRIITAAALILATPCARAFALRRSGLMRFRYDNIAVRNPSERRTDSSLFHGYNLDLGGLLLNRAVGSFDSGVEYSDGANVDASVSVDSPRQRIFAYNASAQLFHPSVRRYFVFDPNFSVRSTKFSGSGGAPGHTVSDDGWGFTSGLTLWKLPSLSVSRQFNTVRDLNGPIPTDQKLHLRTDTISHRIGRVRLKFSEDERRTDDRLSLSPAPLLGTRRGLWITAATRSSRSGFNHFPSIRTTTVCRMTGSPLRNPFRTASVCAAGTFKRSIGSTSSATRTTRSATCCSGKRRCITTFAWPAIVLFATGLFPTA